MANMGENSTNKFTVVALGVALALHGLAGFGLANMRTLTIEPPKITPPIKIEMITLNHEEAPEPPKPIPKPTPTPKPMPKPAVAAKPASQPKAVAPAPKKSEPEPVKKLVKPVAPPKPITPEPKPQEKTPPKPTPAPEVITPPKPVEPKPQVEKPQAPAEPIIKTVETTTTKKPETLAQTHKDKENTKTPQTTTSQTTKNDKSSEGNLGSSSKDKDSGKDNGKGDSNANSNKTDSKTGDNTGNKDGNDKGGKDNGKKDGGGDVLGGQNLGTISNAHWRVAPNYSGISSENVTKRRFTVTITIDAQGNIKKVSGINSGDPDVNRQLRSAILRAKLHPFNKGGQTLAGTAIYSIVLE